MGVPFSRETAIRIGRAVHALPGVTVAELVDGLATELGWPLDEGMLSRVTFIQLRNALRQRMSSDTDVEFSSVEAADRFSRRPPQGGCEDPLGPVRYLKTSTLPLTISRMVPCPAQCGSPWLPTRQKTLMCISARLAAILVYQVSASRGPADRYPPPPRSTRDHRRHVVSCQSHRRLPPAAGGVDRRPGGGQGHQCRDLSAEARRTAAPLETTSPPFSGGWRPILRPGWPRP